MRIPLSDLFGEESTLVMPTGTSLHIESDERNGSFVSFQYEGSVEVSSALVEIGKSYYGTRLKFIFHVGGDQCFYEESDVQIKDPDFGCWRSFINNGIAVEGPYQPPLNIRARTWFETLVNLISETDMLHDDGMDEFFYYARNALVNDLDKRLHSRRK